MRIAFCKTFLLESVANRYTRWIIPKFGVCMFILTNNMRLLPFDFFSIRLSLLTIHFFGNFGCIKKR